MRPHKFNQHRHIGRAWYAVPVSVFAAFVAALVVVNGSGRDGHSGDIAAAQALSLMPYVTGGGAFPVPSAASVFTDGRHEVAEHVDTF